MWPCRFVPLIKTTTFAGLSKTDFKFPKLHDATHFADFIQLYGAAVGCRASHFESAHKFDVKDAWAASNKQVDSFMGQVGQASDWDGRTRACAGMHTLSVTCHMAACQTFADCAWPASCQSCMQHFHASEVHCHDITEAPPIYTAPPPCCHRHLGIALLVCRVGGGDPARRRGSWVHGSSPTTRCLASSTSTG